tara:strand:- start:746 stop:910 length:165 start_codon:yes stop_codon:yes gene_type:complete
MSNHPIPDSNQEYMVQQWGTKYLITDPRADYYLKKASKSKNNPPEGGLTTMPSG